jgi:predicted  nucleic acid-binding Zn-ribbon protein
MSALSTKNQDYGMDKQPNESDKLLSDKYILAKEIRDLNRTLKDSVDRMKSLEEELKNKLKLKEKLEQYTIAFDEILKETVKTITPEKNDFEYKLNQLIEKLTADTDLDDIKILIKDKEKNVDRIKHQLIDNTCNLTNEITHLEKKIDDRKNVHSDALVERDLLKAQMKEILEEFAGHKL